MQALKAKIAGWSASFREPTMSGKNQFSLPIPAPSTIYGILSAAVGKPITPYQTDIAYSFTSLAKGMDLEKVYQNAGHPTRAGHQQTKTNVLNREWLFNPELTIYASDTSLAKSLRKPRFIMTMGRSQDLAAVRNVELVTLEEREDVVFRGTALPAHRCIDKSGKLVALPLWFTTDIPRCAMNTRPYLLHFGPVSLPGKNWCDPGEDMGVFWHGLG